MVSIIKFASSSKMAAGAPTIRLWFQAGNTKNGEMWEMVVLSTLKAPPDNFCLYLTGCSGLKGTGSTVFKVVIPRKEGRIGGNSQFLLQTQICSNRTLTSKILCVQLTSSYLQNWEKISVFWTPTQGIYHHTKSSPPKSSSRCWVWHPFKLRKSWQNWAESIGISMLSWGL